MPSLTSEQVNHLILKYFQDEGLFLSAYALQQETNADNSSLKVSDVKLESGLVQLLLKGIQMVDIEQQTKSRTDALSVQLKDEERVNSDTSKLVVKNLKLVSDLNGGLVAAYVSPLCLVIAGSETLAWIPNTQKEPLKLEGIDNPTCIEPLGMDEVTGDNIVLIGTASGSVTQWRLSSAGAILQSLLMAETQLGPVLLIRISPSKSMAAIVDAKWSNVYVWNLATRQLIATLNLGKTSVDPTIADLAWISWDSTLAVAHSDGIAVFQVGSGSTPSTPIQPKAWLKSHSRPVSHLAFDPVAQLLASGGDDGYVCIWNAQSPEPIRKFCVSSLKSPVSHVSWTGIDLLTSTTDGSISLWNVRPSEAEALCSVDVGEPVLAMEISKHKPTHCSVLTSRSVRVYELTLNPHLLHLVGLINGPNLQSTAWAPDGNLVVCSKNASAIVQMT